jgi:hypothetical protein
VDELLRRFDAVTQTTPLGEAIWIYSTCRDRDAALMPMTGTKPLEAAGFAALALAVADEPEQTSW